MVYVISSLSQSGSQPSDIIWGLTAYDWDQLRPPMLNLQVWDIALSYHKIQ